MTRRIGGALRMARALATEIPTAARDLWVVEHQILPHIFGLTNYLALKNVVGRLKATEDAVIDKPYAYHKPSADGLDKINRLRAHFSEGERLMREVCPESRQRSTAITQNETTAMWAIKAVVFNDPLSQVDG